MNDEGSERRPITVRGHRLPVSRALLVLAVLVVTFGCSSQDAGEGATSGGTAPPPRTGGSVVVGTSAEVDGFNPLSSQWAGPAYQIARSVLDPLVVMDADGNWQPYLAESITPNDDFTVWTIGLRPGVVFHNGTPLDADALVTYLEAAVVSPLTSQGFPETPEIEKTGDLTVTMTFTQPWSMMPTALTEQIGYVIAPEQVTSGDSTHPIGTGPFVFEEWQRDAYFRAARNPNYWRDELPYLDRIEFRPMPDTSSRLNALEAGDLDLAEAPSVDQRRLDELAASGFTVVDDVDNVGAASVLMKTDTAPFDDVRVRRAVAHAIDREAFRDAVLDPSLEVADQPYPEASKWHSTVDYPAYDPERARELVDDYEAEHGPISFSLTVIAVPAWTTAAEFLQQQLEAVGIEMSIDVVEQVTFVQRFLAGDYQAVHLASFFNGSADPDALYLFFNSGAAAPDTPIKTNFSRYASNEVDAAMEAQRRTDDFDERKAEWDKIWQAFADDVPYAFLVHDTMAWVTKPDVYGLTGFTTPEGVALPAINRWTPFYTAVYVDRD